MRSKKKYGELHGSQIKICERNWKGEVAYNQCHGHPIQKISKVRVNLLIADDT